MIKDPDKLTKIREKWAAVELMKGKIRRSAFASVAGSIGGKFPFYAADAANNLPFVHAMGVMNDVLEQSAKEGRFKCTSHHLGALLKAAKSELEWVDYDVISKAKDERNGVSHRGKLVPRKECWEHIEAVRGQLVKWKVIEVNPTESD